MFESIFAKSSAYDQLRCKADTILNEYAWGDLKLFYGTTSNPAYHLMNRVGSTHAVLGEGALATMLVTPTHEAAVIAPFNRINTYVDITDDIAAGASLFMAGVTRAQKHLHMLTSLSENEFSFSIFDEPFSGTNPTEGAVAEYSILESMADYRNAFNIVATYYPTVMLLERNASKKALPITKAVLIGKREIKKSTIT